MEDWTDTTHLPSVSALTRSPLFPLTGCKSATYCSVDCQKADWGGHKKICKVLNAGRARQLRHPDHLGAVGIPGQMISGLSGMDDDCREIFRLFRATKPDAETRRTMMRQIAEGMSMVSERVAMHS